MKYLVILFSLLLLSETLVAQSGSDDNFRRFRAFPAFGFNASQVDGDDLAGFKKFGIHVGAGVHIMFDKRMSLSTEILFNQRGSRSGLTKNNTGPEINMTLNYADMVAMFNYHDKERMIFSAGLYLGSLVNAKLDGDVFNPDLQDNMGRFEVGYTAGLTVLVIKKLGFSLRYSGSINSIGTDEISNLPKNSMRNRSITLRTSYLF